MTLDSFGPDGSGRTVALNVHADISRLVRGLRERTGLMQRRFAAKLGVTLPTINRWENAKAKPSPLALRQTEGLLGGMGDQGRDLLRKYFARGKNRVARHGNNATIIGLEKGNSLVGMLLVRDLREEECSLFNHVIENSKARAYCRHLAAFDGVWAEELAGGSLSSVM